MILEKIVEHKKKEVAERKRSFSGQDLREHQFTTKKNRFRDALKKPGMSLIAEVKKASPSRGVFVKDFDPVKLAAAYERGGASAVSVLTDTRFFMGSLHHLKKVREKVKLPILRKDFIIDQYQIYETAFAGADALLLIAGILEKEKLRDFIQLAATLNLDVLVEVHTQEELEKALCCGAEIIGINNRDLRTFRTDIMTTLKLAEFVPENCVLVSESGISSEEDVKKLAEAGVDALLVGEALVTSPNIEAKVRELIKGGGRG